MMKVARKCFSESDETAKVHMHLVKFDKNHKKFR
jgi:hypothetical protein